MKRFMALAIAGLAAGIVTADEPKSSETVASPTGPIEKTTYIESKTGDFIQSIERMGPCEIPGPPKQIIRLPYQLYPHESLVAGETGKVVVEVNLDRDWCARKATVLTSSRYWRLDEVSVKYAMTIKMKPRDGIELKLVDGEPTLTIPIVWGINAAVGAKK